MVHRSAHRPARRIHRDAPDRPAAGPTPQVTPPVPVGPTPPAPPPYDLDRLDRDLWRRFEKRMRVERQRRGRD